MKPSKLSGFVLMDAEGKSEKVLLEQEISFFFFIAGF